MQQITNGNTVIIWRHEYEYIIMSYTTICTVHNAHCIGWLAGNASDAGKLHCKLHYKHMLYNTL